MSDSSPRTLLELMAEKFRMLADPTRLAILQVLLSGEKSVGEVVSTTGQGQANVSKHLKLLADSGVLRRRKAGLHVIYAVNDPLIGSLCELVCDTVLNEARTRVEEGGRLLESWRRTEPVARD